MANISKCLSLRNAQECAISGGTTFTVAFQPKESSLSAHIEKPPMISTEDHPPVNLILQL